MIQLKNPNEYGELNRYRGITYPSFLRNKFIQKLWRRYMCKREIHLFDEVLSGGNPWSHYLVCDCCQLVVNISSIDTSYLGEKKDG